MDTLTPELERMLEKGFREIVETNREILRLLEVLEERRKLQRTSNPYRKVSDTTKSTTHGDHVSSTQGTAKHRKTRVSFLESGHSEVSASSERWHSLSQSKSSSENVHTQVIEVHTIEKDDNKSVVANDALSENSHSNSDKPSGRWHALSPGSSSSENVQAQDSKVHAIGIDDNKNVVANDTMSANSHSNSDIVVAKAIEDIQHVENTRVTAIKTTVPQEAQAFDSRLRSKKTVPKQDNRIKDSSINKERAERRDQIVLDKTAENDSAYLTTVTYQPEKESLNDYTVDSAIDETSLELFYAFYSREIEQQSPKEEKRMIIDREIWNEYAYKEEKKGRVAKDMHEDGQDTIFCLDISSSMKGEPLKQAKSFIKQKVKDFQNAGHKKDVYEHVALVTFGWETKVQQHLTYEYYELITALEHVRSGGPSPITAGLKMCEAVLKNTGSILSASSDKVNPKVYVISDGEATPSTFLTGPDICSKEEQKMEQNQVVQFCKYLHDKYHLSIIGVPVGQSVPETWTCYDEVEILPVVNTFDIDEESVEYNVKPSGSDQPNLGTSEPNLGTREPNLGTREPNLGTSEPNLGTRVRRKGDALCGTVTKHYLDGIRITWDEMGALGEVKEDVYTSQLDGIECVEQARVLNDELIAVGCRVKSKHDLYFLNQDENSGTEGTVIKVKDAGVVEVIWDHGEREQCRYGLDGMFELEIVQPGKTRGSSSTDLKGAASLTYPKDRTHQEARNLGANTEESFTWKWKGSDGAWQTYPSETNKAIEAAYHTDPLGRFLFEVDGTRYTIMFSRMAKVNVNTKEKFPVSRR